MLNLQWTIADMDAISRLVSQGWRPDDLAEKFSVRESEMIQLLKRNGMIIHKRRVWSV